jgi:hypothetical protein
MWVLVITWYISGAQPVVSTNTIEFQNQELCERAKAQVYSETLRTMINIPAPGIPWPAGAGLPSLHVVCLQVR